MAARELKDLPTESIFLILQYSDIQSIERFLLSCKSYREEIGTDLYLWKKLVSRDFEDLYPLDLLIPPIKEDYRSQYYYLLDKTLISNARLIDESYNCFGAAADGDLLVLKRKYQQGYFFDVWVYEAAGHFDRLDCLQFLREIGCPQL